MRESCRICGRELCGNQRRWIFHPASRPSLRVLLAHALGRGLRRDGRGEFACSKCAFALERMFRFDAVAARVAALSLERLQRLLLDKRRLRLCVAELYRRSNAGDAGGGGAEPHRSYADLVRDDLELSGFESWAAGRDDAAPDPPLLHCAAAEARQKSRRCRGCAALRVADSDYEAVCKVPRRFGRRSASCGPTARYSDLSRTSEADRRSPASSVGSVEDPEPDPDPDPEPDPDPDPGEPDPEEAGPPWRKPRTGTPLGLLRYRLLTPPRGSRIPVLVKGKMDQNRVVPEEELLSPEEEMEELQELWMDDYLEFGPIQQVDGEPGDQETRRPRDQETKRPGDQETRRPGDQETRRPGDQETKRPRDQETRRPGDQETRRPRDQETPDP